jgi:hypothetical protein
VQSSLRSLPFLSLTHFSTCCACLPWAPFDQDNSLGGPGISFGIFSVPTAYDAHVIWPRLVGSGGRRRETSKEQHWCFSHLVELSCDFQVSNSIRPKWVCVGKRLRCLPEDGAGFATLHSIGCCIPCALSSFVLAVVYRHHFDLAKQRIDQRYWLRH